MYIYIIIGNIGNIGNPGAATRMVERCILLPMLYPLLPIGAVTRTIERCMPVIFAVVKLLSFATARLLSFATARLLSFATARLLSFATARLQFAQLLSYESRKGWRSWRENGFKKRGEGWGSLASTSHTPNPLTYFRLVNYFFLFKVTLDKPSKLS